MRSSSSSSSFSVAADSAAARAAAQTAASAATTSSSSNKKKFGKNLNKLVNKPVAPPIVDRLTSGTTSRNGLLLLSSSKSKSSAAAGGGGGGSSNNNNSAAATAAAGASSSFGGGSSLLASSSRGGGGGGTAEPFLQASTVSAASAAPDAWGASAAAASAAANRAAPSPAPAASPTAAAAAAAATEAAADSAAAPPAPSRLRAPTSTIAAGPAWDEYGGREVPQDHTGNVARPSPQPHGTVSTSASRGLVDVGSGGGGGGDSQAALMSRLARERAEHKRREEAARAREQQERAAQRLRDLDLGHPTPHRGERGGGPGGAGSAPLQPVDPTTASLTPPPPPHHLLRWENTRSGTKELWEPDQHQRPREQNHSSGEDAAATDNMNSMNADSQPLIHLTSFDDPHRAGPLLRDPAKTGAPRMLFDPKSGSMVAVKSRGNHHHEPHNHQSHGSSFSQPGTANSNNMNGKKKSGGGGGGSGSGGGRSSARNRGGPGASNRDGSVGIVGRGNDSSLNDGTKMAAREGNRPTAARRDPSVGGAATQHPNSAVAHQTALSARNTTRLLPRTCGVLYRRDEHGNCYCADDCDGDLGYGSHSVPGGRAHNPTAYAQFVHQHYRGGGPTKSDTNTAIRGGEAVGDDPDALQYYGAYGGADGDAALLYTGYNPSEEKDEDEEQPFVPPEPIEYVRGDDKLELVTGVDDSPSLKPTAKEFAPSQAALAAARAAMRKEGMESSEEEEKKGRGPLRGEDRLNEEGNEGADDDGSLGLGFDPTLDMDFVMRSPSHDLDDRKRVESLAISDLVLDPSAFAVASSSVAAASAGVSSDGPRHIFAFGSSGTWGTGVVGHHRLPVSSSSGVGGIAGGVGTWTISGAGEDDGMDDDGLDDDVNALFGSGVLPAAGFGTDDDDDENDDIGTEKAALAAAASFLHLPASSSWGTPSVPVSLTSGLPNPASDAAGTTATRGGAGD